MPLGKWAGTNWHSDSGRALWSSKPSRTNSTSARKSSSSNLNRPLQQRIDVAAVRDQWSFPVLQVFGDARTFSES